MRFSFTIVLLALTVSCASRKSVDALYQEQKVRIDLTCSQNTGYRPLSVDFTAYLETRDRSVEREIREVKWIIKGPGGYEREIVHESMDLQNDENEEGFFYLEYDFNLPGNYSVQLILNDGEFSSRRIPVKVLDLPTRSNPRF